MLSGLTKRYRPKAALALAALYAFCILVPHAAMALDGAAAAHCLTDDHAAAHVHSVDAKLHTHAGTGVHDHHDDGAAQGHADKNIPHKHSDQDGKGHSGTCCGLFCVTALAHEPALALSAPPAAALDGLGEFYLLVGRGPDRINRPPIG